MSASVVIPAHNAESTLAVQLAALAAQQSPPSFEVIVVANRCTDRTSEVATAFSSVLDLRVIAAEDQAGAPYARNVGVAAAKSDRILHCDADDRVTSSWVSEFVRSLESHDVVGGMARLPNDTECWFIEHSLYERDSLPSSGGQQYPLGACMAYRRGVHSAIGGWNEAYEGKHGGEEAAFAVAANRAGFRLGFVPGAVVEYTPRPDAAGVLRQRFSYGRGRALLLVHYFPEQLAPVTHELVSGMRAIVSSLASGCRPGQGRSSIVRTAWLVGRTVQYWVEARSGHWPEVPASAARPVRRWRNRTPSRQS